MWLFQTGWGNKLRADGSQATGETPIRNGARPWRTYRLNLALDDKLSTTMTPLPAHEVFGKRKGEPAFLRDNLQGEFVDPD